MDQFTYTVYTTGRMPPYLRGVELPQEVVLERIEAIQTRTDKYTQSIFPGLESNVNILRINERSGYRTGFLNSRGVLITVQLDPSPAIVFSATNTNDLSRLASSENIPFLREKVLEVGESEKVPQFA